MKNKVKAFTVLEALISLMLISIIIGLIYSLFTVVGRQMTLYEKENNEVVEYNLFNNVIKRDIERSNNYKILDNKVFLLDYLDNSITYHIYNGLIIRSNQVKIDTFNFQIRNHSFIELKNHKKAVIELEISLLRKSIFANYFLKKDITNVINDNYLYEN